jgi:hypothetical protein
MALIFSTNAHFNLNSEQRREQQQRFLKVMNAHFENGLPRSGG